MQKQKTMKKSILLKRISAESPDFFKKITKIAVSIGAIGVAIVTAPVTFGISLPATIITAGGYMAAIGGAAAAVAKTTVKNPEELQD